MPHATLSLGWTSAGIGPEKHYTWPMVKKMYDIVHDAEISQPISFNVKGEYLMKSMQQLKWLMQITHSSLCVYLHKEVSISPTDFLNVRRQLPKKRLYFTAMSEVFPEVRKMEAERIEDFPDDTLILQAQLWQIRKVDNMDMLMSSESFMIKHGMIRVSMISIPVSSRHE
jgi:hypothetical protein